MGAQTGLIAKSEVEAQHRDEAEVRLEIRGMIKAYHQVEVVEAAMARHRHDKRAKVSKPMVGLINRAIPKMEGITNRKSPRIAERTTDLFTQMMTASRSV